jgi:hypothetical protein
MQRLLMVALMVMGVACGACFADEAVDIHTGEVFSIRQFKQEQYKVQELERKVEGMQKVITQLFARVRKLEGQQACAGQVSQ